MVVLTPLGHDGMPIEVPQSVHMVAFADLKVLVTSAQAMFPILLQWWT